MRNRPLIVAWACFAAFQSLFTYVAAAPPSFDEIEFENAIVQEVPKPHTKWAKPYALGKVRVLFIAGISQKVSAYDGWPQWSGALVDPVALADRFDLEADAVLIDPGGRKPYEASEPGTSAVFGGELGEQRLNRLLKEPYDCYVLGGMTLLGSVPDAARATMLDHVRNGAGLFFNGKASDDPKLAEMVGEPQSVPPDLRGIKLDVHELGRGRVIAFQGQPWNIWTDSPAEVFALAPIFGIDLAYDVKTQFKGRALLWAAAKQPTLVLAVSAGEGTIQRTELADHSIDVTWESAGLTRPIELQVRIRSQSHPPRVLPTTTALDPSSGSLSFEIPALPAGRYEVDVRARSERGTESWAVASLEIGCAEHVGRVRPGRAWGEAGTPVPGSVEVRTPDRNRYTLRLQIIDKHGRALSRQEIRSPQGKVDFHLEVPPWAPNVVGIEAALVSDEGPVAFGYSNAYAIPHRRQDEWNFVAWGRLYSSPYSMVLMEEALARMGITSRLETSATTFWFMDRAGMNYTPYCSSGIPLGASRRPADISFTDYPVHAPLPMVDAEGVLRGYECWNDEPATTKMLNEQIARQRQFRRKGVYVYSTGDEGTTFGSCLHPACWKTYLKYLESQYNSIEALNASWGSSFTRFDEIEPIIDNSAFPDVEDTTKRASAIRSYANNAWSSLQAPPGSNTWKDEMRNIPRWFDRHAFQYWNCARQFERFHAAARRIDPQATSGPEGTAFSLEQDIDAIVRATDWWVLYDNSTLEILRSIAPRHYRYGKWIGYDDSERNMEAFWWSFLRGANSQGWWRIDHYVNNRAGPGRARGIVESAGTVFDGLGTLLNVRGEMLHDGIAMLHSFPSAHASQFGAGPAYGTWTWHPQADHGEDWPFRPGGKNHDAWHRAIRALGLQFTYVTDRMLNRGEFDAREAKVLILPQCEALGTHEAQVIRDYVAAGGTVIADVRPGIYDEHCKARTRGILDDLFGVEHTGNVPPKVVEGGVIRGRIGEQEVAVDFKAIRHDYPAYYKWLYGNLEGLSKARKKPLESYGEAAPKLHVNPAVTLTTGTALGDADGTPICIENHVGRGRAILLNFPFNAFPQLTVPGTSESGADFLAALFTSAGVTQPLHLLDNDGGRHRNAEAVRWQVGKGIQVVAVYGPTNTSEGLWRRYREGRRRADRKETDAQLVGLEPVTVRLPVAKHVFAIGDRQTGNVEQVTVRPRPWRPVFLVVADGSLEAPAFSSPKATATRGQILQFGIDVPGPAGLRALKLRMTDPAGEDAPWFARTLIIEKSQTQLDLPIAYNERKGNWKITATDLYTGSVGSAGFSVE